MNVQFSLEIQKAAPELQVVTIEADVINCETPDALWDEITAVSEEMRSKYLMPMINKRPAIAGTREAYKALGKDPNRYRPSAEALTRRVVKGMELYRIDALVDVINLISLNTGYSIGGFDADKVQGEVIELGRGREGEDFEGIGRGPLNIDGLPVYRDEVGGIGTPTSDNERTKIDINTRRLLMVINMYREEMSADDIIKYSEEKLAKYCHATNFVTKRYRP
jgi:DNA/RNA-binding domain of Phe-tRNA-synthetase-like protein